MSERYSTDGGSTWATPFGMSTETAGTYYLYDNLGRLTAIRAPGSMNNRYVYDEAGRVRETYTEKLGAGGGLKRKTEYAFDGAGRLTGLVNTTVAGVASRYAYEYNYSGNRKSEKIENGDGAYTRHFNYDGENRLTEVWKVAEGGMLNEAVAADEHYGYDRLGNRTETKRDGEETTYSYSDPNKATDPEAGGKLMKDTKWRYYYDERGSLYYKQSVSDPGGHSQYYWDGRGQLRRAVKYEHGAKMNEVKYEYDVVGRRVSKWIDSDGNGTADTKTKYAYDGADILYEFDGANTLQARHQHGAGTDDPLYTQTSASMYFYYHKDGLGSVREITDGTGKVAKRYEYDAFGRITKKCGSLAAEFVSTYTYTGRQWDAEIEMYYYRARYYDATIGRFISEDPEWKLNLYAYVGNNPMNYTDPSGKSDNDVGWLVWLFFPDIYRKMLPSYMQFSTQFMNNNSSNTLTPTIVDALDLLYHSDSVGEKLVLYAVSHGFVFITMDYYTPARAIPTVKDGILNVTIIADINKLKELEVSTVNDLAAVYGHEIGHIYYGVFDANGIFLRGTTEYWNEQILDPYLMKSVGASFTMMSRSVDHKGNAPLSPQEFIRYQEDLINHPTP